jgi:hypothetical protein
MKDDITRMAREAGLHLATDVNWMPIIGIEYLERFAALVAAAERERIKESNAPVIKTINEHIKALEEARKAEREACAKVCDARHMGDNNREDMEARRCAAAIRARGNT